MPFAPLRTRCKPPAWHPRRIARLATWTPASAEGVQVGGNSATRYDLRSFPLCSLLTHNTTTHNPPTPSSLRASYALRSFTPLVNPSSAPPFAHSYSPLAPPPPPTRSTRHQHQHKSHDHTITRLRTIGQCNHQRLRLRLPELLRLYRLPRLQRALFKQLDSNQPE